MTTAQEALKRAVNTPTSGAGSGDWLYTAKSTPTTPAPTNSTVNEPISAPTGSIARDFEREKSAIQELGLDPLSLANLSPKDLFESTYSPDELAQMSDYQKILQFEDSQNRLKATPEPTNTMMAGLEDALRMKNDVGNQPIQPSELFEKAGIATKGVSGYATLNQALQNNSALMQDRYNNFARTIEKTGGALADTYKSVLDEYKVNLDEYQMVHDTFQSVLDNVMRSEAAIELATKQADLEKEAKEWAINNMTPQDQADLRDQGYMVTNGKIVPIESAAGKISTGDTSGLANIFQISGKSKYRTDGGFECAEAHNLITDGSHEGHLFTDKMANVYTKDSPKVGNGVVFPLSGSGEYGHEGTVLDFDPSTGVFSTVEWNHNGDGKQGFYTYTIDEMNKKYGNNWGFTNSTLKPEYENQLTKSSAPKAENVTFKDTPDWFQTYIKDYYVDGDFTESEIRGMINRRTDLSKDEKAEYVALFDRMINEKADTDSSSVFGKFWDVAGKVTGGTRTWRELKEEKAKTQKEKDSSGSSSSRPSLAELLNNK